MAVAVAPIADPGPSPMARFMNKATAPTSAMPKMSKNTHRAADRIDYLYSELVCVAR